MKFTPPLLVCACLAFVGCGQTEVAEQPAPESSTASSSGAATPAPAPAANRDPRLEFNKLVQFLGTKNPRVYWLNTGIESASGLDPKFVQSDGNYKWRDGSDFQNIEMRVSDHNFDANQNLGTVVWLVGKNLSAGDYRRNTQKRYKATYYFSNEWSLQKVEWSLDKDEPFQVARSNTQMGKTVTKFFQEAINAAFKQ